MNVMETKSELLALASRAGKRAEEMERENNESEKILWANVQLAIEDALQQIESAEAEYLVAIKW